MSADRNLKQILLAQQDAIRKAHLASLEVVNDPDNFDEDKLHALLNYRSERLAELDSLNVEKQRMLDSQEHSHESGLEDIRKQIRAYLEKLAASDARLEDMIVARQNELTKEMASLMKFSNLPSSTQGAPPRGRLFDVMR